MPFDFDFIILSTANGVINRLIVLVNSKLQRVHLRGIYHRFYSIDASFRWLCRLHSGDIGIAGSTDERRKQSRHEKEMPIANAMTNVKTNMRNFAFIA